LIGDGANNNQVFTITYNFAAVGFELEGWITPLLAAILMPVRSILSASICPISQSVKKR